MFIFFLKIVYTYTIYECVLPSDIGSFAIFQIKSGPTFPNVWHYFLIWEYKNLGFLNKKYL